MFCTRSGGGGGGSAIGGGSNDGAGASLVGFDGGVWSSHGAPAPMRALLLPLLEQLGANRSLVELDITGQQIGDAGARTLALALVS